MKKFFVSVIFFYQISCLFASPAAPLPEKVLQPDKREILVYFKGDEFFSWEEDSEGFVIIKNDTTGFWEYGTLNGNKLTPSGLVVDGTHKPEKNIKKEMLQKMKERRELK